MGAVSHSVNPSSRHDPATGGLRRPTQADVAELAGVSTATVSHILSGRADRKGKGRTQTRDKVERAMEQLGYVPNWAGRALRLQRTGLIGALVSAPNNPWRENLIALAQRELARHSLDLVVFPDVQPGAAMDRVKELLDRRAVDACFVVHLEDDEEPSHLAECPIPVIAFAESGFEGVAKVRHGYADAAAAVTEELVDRGVRRLVLVTEGSGTWSDSDPNFADPILRALDLRAERVDVTRAQLPYRIVGELSRLPWEMLATATVDDPVVVVCLSDRLAIQIAAECLRLGIDLGRTVGVVGRGNLPEGAELAVPLSTLGTTEADYTAVFAALAEASRSGSQITEDWNFPWRFLERQSTAGLLRNL